MEKNAEIIMIAGGRGSGKTTRLMEMSAGYNRIITLDPIGNFKAPGFKVVHNLADLYKEMKAGWNTGFKVVMRTPRNEVQCVPIMQQLARDLQVIQQPYYDGKDNRKIMLQIDEAHKFFPNRKMSPEEQEPLEDIIAIGRHYGIEMIAATQRLAKLWTEYRDNAATGKCYFFMQGDDTGMSAVLSIIGNQYRDELRGLRVHEYLFKGQAMEIKKGRNRANFK